MSDELSWDKFKAVLFIVFVDCVLNPTPFYTRIKSDIGERSQLKSLYVHTDEPGPDGRAVFKLTVDKIRKVYEEAKQQVCGS